MHGAQTYRPGVGIPSIEVRLSGPSDLAQLEALVERCSFETTYRRFHGAVGHVVAHELDRIAHPSPDHRSWVALAEGAIRGTATLAWGRDGSTEAAFLVEDDWFRRGIGRALFDALGREAIAAGVPAVTAWVQADNERARRFFRSVAPGARTAFTGGGELEIVVPVPAPRDRSLLPTSTPAYRETA
jgi:GNAT superfamily N-acetyltransferase